MLLAAARDQERTGNNGEAAGCTPAPPVTAASQHWPWEANNEPKSWPAQAISAPQFLPSAKD